MLFQKRSAYRSFSPRVPEKDLAVTRKLETPDIVNDPAVLQHTVQLTGLTPDTTYVYTVGDNLHRSELAEFTTAPATARPFSFVYMGDAQNGLERWESVIQRAHRHRPDTAFYVMAGDLVNRGKHREEWDSLFGKADGVWNEHPVVPALGNHEYQDGDPSLYLEHFVLPENGPDTLTPEKAYAVRYGNALFIILDSNEPPEAQTAWLERKLKNSDATWKFVVYHHPSYSSSPKRNNPDIRKLWGVVFDKYGVDMVLQGHDHAYLRTNPMRGGRAAEADEAGVVYVVSVSGTKYYEQGDFDYSAATAIRTSTYQTFDIQLGGDRLVYRSHDIDGNLVDSLTLEK